MNKVVDYVVVYDDGVRKRHYHETQKGKIVYFAVQLEVEVESKWRAVVRYDCSHGFSHVDKFDLKGNKEKTPLDFSFESALTYGEWDINNNWRKYKADFLKGVDNG